MKQQTCFLPIYIGDISWILYFFIEEVSIEQYLTTTEVPCMLCFETGMEEGG